MSVNQSAIAATLNADIANINTQIAAIGILATASIAQLAPLAEVVQDALEDFQSAATQLDGDIDTTTTGGIAVGVPVPLMIAALQEQTSDVQQLSTVLVAQGYLARIGVNVSKAPG